IGPGVRSLFGAVFDGQAVAASTVGPDGVRPEVLLAATPTPAIEPPIGEVNVDPATHVFVTFTEPVQPLSIGTLDGNRPPVPSNAVQLEFGPVAGRVSMPFVVRFPSVLDLTRVELVPAFDFPGGSGGGIPCSAYSQVQVHVVANGTADLGGNR